MVSSPPNPVVNFGPGPAKLPPSVIAELLQPDGDLVNWRGTGLGVLETSHRSAICEKCLKDAEASVRQLLQIPDGENGFDILWMTGGGTQQFAAVVYNILGVRAVEMTTESDNSHKRDKAMVGSFADVSIAVDYLISGHWSSKAAEEATTLGANVNAIRIFDDGNVDEAKGGNGERDEIKYQETWTASLSQNPAYIYYCDNETIDGIEYPSPDYIADAVLQHRGSSNNFPPLICDASSNFMTRRPMRPDTLARHAVIFASAQKNIGPAGVTVVIVRKDFTKKDRSKGYPSTSHTSLPPPIPSCLDYSIFSSYKSAPNTPPVYAIYVTGLVLQWIRTTLGDLVKVGDLCQQKAAILYDIVDADNDGFYYCRVPRQFRSRVNVVLQLRQTMRNGDKSDNVTSITDQFIKAAEAAGLLQLRGHRLVGGIRASLYIPITIDEVKRLARQMQSFKANMCT